MDVKQGAEDATKRTFSHIVIGDDDCDEVIQAGVVSVPEPEPQPEPQVQPEPEFQPQPEPEPEPEASPVVPARPSKSEYQETTLEDLKGEAMPFAQKVVLVGAALLIIVALVYWFVIR